MPVVQGFEWVDEGKHPGKHKWGYVAWQPGASIEVDVPLPPGRPDNSSAYTIGLGVRHLWLPVL